MYLRHSHLFIFTLKFIIHAIAFITNRSFSCRDNEYSAPISNALYCYHFSLFCFFIIFLPLQILSNYFLFFQTPLNDLLPLFYYSVFRLPLSCFRFVFVLSFLYFYIILPCLPSVFIIGAIAFITNAEIYCAVV